MEVGGAAVHLLQGRRANGGGRGCCTPTAR